MYMKYDARLLDVMDIFNDIQAPRGIHGYACDFRKDMYVTAKTQLRHM